MRGHSGILALALLGVILSAFLFSAPAKTTRTAGVIQLRNDNGVMYQGSFAGRIRGDIDGAVFTPEPAFFPITIQSVEFAFHRPQGAGHIADSAKVRVQIYAMADGAPGDILAESEFQVFSTFDEWLSLSLTTPLAFDEPASFMAAMRWLSGTDSEPAPSIATDSNLSAPQALKDQRNLYHDADTVLRPPACQTEFCAHSEFWAAPENVGFNMIRVTIDSPLDPTALPSTPTPTDAPTVELTATTTPSPACHDFNGDGQVGVADIQAVARRWRLSVTRPDPDGDPTTPNYELRFDLDADGVITVLDVMPVVASQGPCFPEPTPTLTLTPTTTSTPTTTPTASVTSTPPPSIPRGTDNLTAWVFIDYRCDRFFQDGVDMPLGDIPVTISFPDGSSETHVTRSPGLAYFFGFDASSGVTVSVDLSVGHRGRSLDNCINSPASIELQPDDFRSGNKTILFGVQVLGEISAP